MTKLPTFFCVIFLISQMNKAMSSEKSLDDQVDISIEYKTNGKSRLIEVYKSTNNALILANNQTIDYNKLEWYSYGLPFLTKIPQRKSMLSFRNVFEMTPTGLNIFVDFLTDWQKDLIKDRIKFKYGLDVNTNQIVKLKPSQFKCSVKVICDSDKVKVIEGYAHSFSDFPLKINFYMHKKSRNCIESHLVEYQNIEIDCSISKELNLEYFSINTKELNLEGKLFGTENETYVTRERISDLASEIYNSFTVKERYDISERDFNSSFFDALADLDFIPVAFNTVLKFFVKNSNDFQAIKYAYENTIKVNSSGDYIRFVIDNSAVNNISRLLSNNRSFGLNYIRNEIERGFRSVVENENSGKSLQIQLKELNERSNVEWKIEGKKVIPKSLIASKLLKNAIKFDRIKKKTPKSVLDKHYSFEFKDENIKYDHMKEQSIKKENLKILKTISSVKSLFDCLEECENLNDCHYVEKSDTSNCYLFDKTADLKLERKDNDRADLYHKKKFEKVEIHGEKVNEYLSSLNHIENAEECWTECLSEKECEAISYNTETLDCYLSKVANNTIETNEISNFLTVTYAHFLNLNNGKMSILGQTKLINHYRNIRSNSLDTCKSECLDDSERCSAVSYRNRTCLMFKSGDYLAERKSDWESALLDELKVAHIVRYNQLELTGNLKTIDSDSEYLCWNECLKLSECFAITFELDKNKCRFIGKSWYVAKRNRNAVTLALETEEIVYKKINVALKEISTYKDSRSVAEFLSGPTIAFNFDWRILVKLSGYGDYRYVGVYLFPYQEPQIENIHVNYDLIIVNMNDYSKSKISSISHYFTNNFYGHQTFIKLKDLLNDIEFSMGDELHVQAVIKKIEWEPFSQPQFIYNRTKLLNHYRSIKASSYSACWEECLEDSKTTSAKKCTAISYKDRTCLMFNHASFLAERIDGWKTVSLDEIKSSPVVRYNQLELSGNLKTILNSESEYSCWSECLKYSECIAVTFEVEKNKCELARNSGYVTRRNKKAVTLALETDTITYMTINFKVNEVSKYTKWTNLTTVISDTTRAFDIDWTVTVSFSGYISRYIGLFLTPNQSPKIENYHVSYELAILNSSDVKKSESYIFEKYFPDNNARGYLEFYYLKDLMNDSNLFSNDSFLVQAVVTKIEWESNTEKQFSYNRTKLINSYKNSTAKSFEGCWEECIEDTDHCIAVSYSQMSCLMFKRGQFLVERNDSWKTVSLEEIISTPIVRYDQLELSGNLKTIETESEYSCWNECLKHSSCFAVTFELNINKCSLIGKHGYSTKRNKNAVSFASEKEKIVYLTIDLKVNEVSTYKDWTNLTYANSNVTRAFDIDWKIAVGFSGNIKRSVGLYLYANQWPRKENYRVNFELILVDTNDYRKSKAYSYEQFFDENIGWGSSDIIQLDTLMKNNDVFSSDSDSFQVRALVTRIQWQPKELEIDWDI